MNQIKIILLALVLFGAGSCKKDLLDKKPLDGFDENTVWADKDAAEGFVFSTYSTVLGGLYYNQQTDDYTDNSCNNYSNSITLENFDNSYDAGWDQYERIRRCNMIIEKVRASSSINPVSKQIMIAEGKFLRGMIYYYLAQRFGGVMLVDKVYDQNEPDFKFPRKTIQETYDFILKDLKEAADSLPLTAQTGRATKGAAWGFITRVGLQGAAYVPAKKTEYIQKVIAAGDSVFKYSSAYQMDADYFGMFNDFGKAQGSKEILLGYFRKGINTTFDGTPMQSLCPNSGNEKMKPGYGPAFVESFEGWPDRFPSQNLVDAYLVIDENDGGKAKKWNATSYYNQYTANAVYSSEVLYKHREKRFAATVVYDSTKLFNNLILTRALGNMNADANRFSDWGMSESNYYYRKGLYETKKLWYSDKTDHHQPIIRLGEVYLNYAEARLLTGNVALAINAINQTRTNHGGLPSLAGSFSVDDLWPIYKDERRVDLALENDRYWSLLRWAKFNNLTVIPELTEAIRTVNISADGKTFSFATVTLNNNNVRKFTQRRFLFPVPISQLQANPNLAPQNDGW